LIFHTQNDVRQECALNKKLTEAEKDQQPGDILITARYRKSPATRLAPNGTSRPSLLASSAVSSFVTQLKNPLGLRFRPSRPFISPLVPMRVNNHPFLATPAVTAKQESNSRTIEYLSPIFADRRIMGGFLPLFSVRSKTGQGIGNIEHFYKMAEFYQALGWNVLQTPPMNLCNTDCPYSVESSRLMDWLYISLDMLLGNSPYSKYDRLVIRSKAAKKYLAEHKKEIDQLRKSKNTDFNKVRPIVYEALKLIWKDFTKLSQAHRYHKEYAAYKQKNPWLFDHILHVLLKEKFSRQRDVWRDWDWRLWGEALAKRQPQALKEAE
jgi:hypothetical protein